MLQLEHDEIKVAIKNQKDQLDFYLSEMERYKALRVKEEKVVAKKLREIAAAVEDIKRAGAGALADVKAKDDKVVELQKKVEELKREKLNADWVSLQEEITEYRVILGGWKDVSARLVRFRGPFWRLERHHIKMSPEDSCDISSAAIWPSVCHA